MLREDDHTPAPTEDSERSRLDPFVVATGDAPPRDQRDLMERPFFSLAKTPRTKPILYKAADIEAQVFGMPEHGMATIWDADVLIWAASQIVAAENDGLTTSRFVRFTPYHLLRAIGRPTGNRQYLLLKAALARLQSTVIATTIRNGPHWRRRQFSWINEWEEMTTRAGRVEGMEFVLPEWFYNSVIDLDFRDRAPSSKIRQPRAAVRLRARPAPDRGPPETPRLPPPDRAGRRPRAAAHPPRKLINRHC
jgi:plasmid replication initiation protein